MPIYVVDKPLGLSSHDVVAVARRKLGTRRVGHAGTLDPLATGVLVLLSESATKLSPFLSGSDKTYLAWIAFGAGTPTLDAEGPIETTGDASWLHAAAVAAALEPFLMITEQRPPAFSAVKQAGVRSYQRARSGDTEELPARPVGYKALTLLGFAHERDALPQPLKHAVPGHAHGSTAFVLPPPLAPLPTALVSVHVEAGTYVRALARDLGAALGVPAHLAGLVRTQAGRLRLEHAVPLEHVADATPVPASEALSLPTVQLDAATAKRLRQGQRVLLELHERSLLIDEHGALVAVADAERGSVRTLRVWQEDVSP